MAGSTKSDSPVPAREELQQRGNPEGDPKALEKTARDQEKAQREQLAGGKAKGGVAKAAQGERKALRQGNVAVARDGVQGNGPTRGRVDNMTRRDDTDVDEGHFCLIDYSKAETRKMVQDQLAPKGSALEAQGFEPGLGSADYGVYLQPGALNPDTGYPETAIVLLRDEHSAQVVVPYDAIKPAGSGRR
jgi:hypothetical protein